MGERSQDEILSELEEIRSGLAEHQEALSALYSRRIALWLEGRGMDPPMRHTILGEACGVGEAAVINALRARREKGEG